jgi:hypothetical protein
LGSIEDEWGPEDSPEEEVSSNMAEDEAEEEYDAGPGAGLAAGLGRLCNDEDDADLSPILISREIKSCGEFPKQSGEFRVTENKSCPPAKRCNERPRKSKSEVNNEGISGTFGRNIPELRNIRKNIPDVRKEHSRTSGTSGNSRTSRMF